jgi:hypothetical protein
MLINNAARGKRLKGGPHVYLVPWFGLETHKPVERYPKFVVIRTGKDAWAVDTLP